MVDFSNVQIVEAIPLQVQALTQSNQVLSNQNAALTRTNKTLKIICAILGTFIFISIINWILDWFYSKQYEGLIYLPQNLPSAKNEEPPKVLNNTESNTPKPNI